jgi:hypothetical protein
MLRIILLLLVVAGVAGYFTRPTEAQMSEKADAVLNDAGNIAEGLENIGATLAGERAYENLYVGAKYTVTLGGDPVVECYGAFTQVMCSRAGSEETTVTPAETKS